MIDRLDQDEMSKQMVVLLVVSVFLISYQAKKAERQKIMAEVERLDLLRQKVTGALAEQKVIYLEKTRI